MRTLFPSIAVGLHLCVVAGCGGSVDAPPGMAERQPAQPEGIPALFVAGPDKGAPSETYPAFKPDMAQLVNHGGYVLKAPVIVTVTWPGEPRADPFEDFGDKIGTTKWWQAVVSEYGVEAATSGPTNHVRMTDEALSQISDAELTALISTKAGDPTISKWPAPTVDTIYTLYLPTTTRLMFGGQDACAIGVGGYHSSTMVNGETIAYAILPQCRSASLDRVTTASSHELAEAATDPHPNARRAWVGFDDSHLAWEFLQSFQSENGDACEFYREASYRDLSDFPYQVQRSWSNKSAAAGHQPCVPQPAAEIYFNVTPFDTEDIYADLSAFGGRSKTKTRGYNIPVGSSRTFAVGFYSDAPMDAWRISAFDGNPLLGGTSTKNLELSVDVADGKNGLKAYVTVKVKAAGRTKTELVTIISNNGKGTRHFMPILIGSRP